MIRYIKIIVISILLVNSGMLYGQAYLGAFAGLNSSKFRGDYPARAYYKSLYGVNAGLNFDIRLGKLVWLSFQPSYSQEGTRIFYDIKGQQEDVDSIHIRLNYYSLPLMLKVSTMKGRFYAIGGVETAYLGNKKLSSQSEELEFEHNVSEWNIALHFGIGYRIPIGLPRLVLELRYTQGVINLTDEPAEKSYIPRVKTTGFKFFTGIEIPLKQTSN